MPSDPSSLSSLPSFAEQVVAHAESRPATLGTGRLICIDGLTGAGKTTLARQVAKLRPEAVVLATDEMLEGWPGLPGLGRTIEELLRPLAAGETGRWRRWDWHAGGWAEWRRVDPGPLLVLEGVGSAASAYDDLVTTLAWLEAPRDVRLGRGVARDGEQMREHLVRWLEDEAHLHAREHTRERADLVLET